MKEKGFVLFGPSTIKWIFKLYENNLLIFIKIIQHFCMSNFLMITYVLLLSVFYYFSMYFNLGQILVVDVKKNILKCYYMLIKKKKIKKIKTSVWSSFTNLST